MALDVLPRVEGAASASAPPRTHTVIVSSRSTVQPYRVYDVAQCGDLVAQSLKSCAARDLARLLVAAGVEDGPIEARGTDGRLRYTVRSLYAFAKGTLRENPRLHIAKFQEMERYWIAPAVEPDP